MRRIDAHCHFWQLGRADYDWLKGAGRSLAPIRRDFNPADYPGDARMVVVQAAPTLAETDYLLSLAEIDDRIAGVVGWVDLSDAGAVTALGEWAGNPWFLGIRPMLQDIAETDWILTRPRADALAALTDLGLCFDALVLERHLTVLERFARANPDLPIVIDHAAKPQPGNKTAWAEGMKALAAVPGVHCKLSGLVTELSPEDRRDPLPALRAIVEPVFDWFGAERVMWGSDWPVLTLAISFADWRGLTDELLCDLTEAERSAVLGGNATRFYGVQP